MVKRYEVLSVQDYWEAEDGEFVDYDDYAELEAKVERLKRQHQEELFNAIQQAERPIMAEVERMEQEAREWKREWDILESACDFWKQEAINRGYEE